jgi:cold-inducible RNA-binding protein
MRQICWTFEAAALILTVSGLIRYFGPGTRSIVSRLWHVPLLGSRLKTTLQKESKMGKRLYVGNLSYSTTEADLRDAFVATGHDVAEVKLVLDRDTGRPRGFAFVEMATDAGAQNAMETLNGKELQGRAIAVSEARERTDSGRGGFGGGGGGGGRGGDRGGFGGGGGRKQRW